MRRQENQKYTEAISYQTVGAARIDPHNLAKYFQSGEIRSKAAKLSGFSETALFGAQVPGIVQIKSDQVSGRMQSQLRFAAARARPAGLL